MSKLRILIADDHEMVRAGIRALIEQEADWELCGMASEGSQAVEMAKQLRPNVVILDLTMPELSGLEALQQIKRVLPETEVLIFSGSISEESVTEVFDAGAKSYIRKADAARHLVSAIKSLALHKPFFTPEISEILFARFIPENAANGRSTTEAKVTPRERAIARLLAEGKSNKEAATLLGISVRTAETHRASLMRKLGLDSLAALVRYAIRNHIIEA